MNINEFMKTGKKIDRYTRVQALMKLHGLRPSDVAANVHVHRTMVSRVIHGRDNSHRVKKYIADFVGVNFRELWGHDEHERRRAA